jgi:hypothetical protein
MLVLVKESGRSTPHPLTLDKKEKATVGDLHESFLEYTGRPKNADIRLLFNGRIIRRDRPNILLKTLGIKDGSFLTLLFRAEGGSS